MRHQSIPIFSPDMVKGRLLRQKNTVQGVVLQWGTELREVLQWGTELREVLQWNKELREVLQWGTELREVLQWNKELRAVLQGNKELGVAEGRMCGIGRRRIVQLVEPHEHFEGGLDSSLRIFGSWSRLYYVST